MRKIGILLLLCFSLTACKSTYERFLCDSIKETNDADTSTLLLSFCIDSDGIGYGLRNSSGEYILSPIYWGIDLGNTTYNENYSEMFVFEDDINYLRILIKTDGKVLSNIYARGEGFILEENYDNLYIDQEKNVAYYTDDVGSYKIDLLSREVSNISYKVKGETSGYLIFEEEDYVFFDTGDKIVEIDNNQVEVGFIDSDYYMYSLDDTIYFNQISSGEVIYQTKLDKSYEAYYVTTKVTPIEDDYMMCISTKFGFCSEYHKMLSKEVLTNEGSDFTYLSNDFVLVRTGKTVNVYDLDFNLLETIDQVEMVLNFDNLVIKKETGLVLYSLVNDIEIPVEGEDPFLHSFLLHDNILGIYKDGGTNIYDKQLNLIAKCTSENVRWFKVDDELILIVDDENSVTTFNNYVKVHEIDTYNEELSSFEFYPNYLRGRGGKLNIYISGDEIIVLNLINEK